MTFEQRKLELQEEHLRILVKNGEPKFMSPWAPYTSGKIGPYFKQCANVISSGEDYHAIRSALIEVMEATGGTDLDAISSGERRDWFFGPAVAPELQMDFTALLKDGSYFAANPKGRTYAHVADLNNEGSSMRDLWVPSIQKHGGEIKQAYFYVDRLEDGVTVLADLGIPNWSIVPMNDRAWTLLKDWGHFTPEQYTVINEYYEDRNAWGENALREHSEVLIDLLKDPKKAVKGEKILNTGFPHMKDELIEIMAEKGFEYRGKEK